MANNLRKIRKGQGLSQEQLGEMTGIDHCTISKYERDVINPSLANATILAKALNVSIDILLKADEADMLVEKNESSSKASRLLSMFQDLSPEHKKLIEKMIYDYYKTDVIWGGKDSVKTKKSNIDLMRDKK